MKNSEIGYIIGDNINQYDSSKKYRFDIRVENSKDFDILGSKDSETFRSTGRLGYQEETHEKKFNMCVNLSDMKAKDKKLLDKIDSNSPSPALKKSSTPIDFQKESENRAPPSYHSVLDAKDKEYPKKYDLLDFNEPTPD